MGDSKTNGRDGKPVIGGSTPGVDVAVSASKPPTRVAPNPALVTRMLRSEIAAKGIARPNAGRPPAPKALTAPEEPPSITRGTLESRLVESDDAEPLFASSRESLNEGSDDRVVGRLRDAAQPRGPRTLVEEGTVVKGVFTSTCPIDVKGRVEGDVAAPSLTIAASGAVHGKVKVGEFRSEGEIAGEFDADAAHLAGVVKSNTVLRARSLQIQLAPVGKKMQLAFSACPPNSGQIAVGDKGAKTT